MESGFSSADAVAKTLGPWGKQYIRTSTPPDVDVRLGQWLTKWSKVNAELLAQKKKPLFRCVFLREINTIPHSNTPLSKPRHLGTNACP